MLPLKDYILDLHSEESIEKRRREHEEWEKNRDFRESNEFNFESRNLFVNYKGKDFFHELETWPRSKYSKWITEVINETLRSFDAKTFIKAIEKIVGSVTNYTEDYDVPGLVRMRIPDYKFWLDKILEICQFFRYYITLIDRDILFFEPVLTTEVTKEIKKDYGNKVYHLCKPEDVKSILKNGLIVSGATGKDIDDPLWYIASDDLKELLNKIDDSTIRKKIQKHTTYRIFPNRIFVFYTNLNPEDVKNTLKIPKFSNNEIIEVDLGRHNIPFFADQAMPEHDGIKFAYSNIDIPPKLLRAWKN